MLRLVLGLSVVLFAQEALAAPVDLAAIDAAYRAQFGAPKGRCDDATFLRRLRLDIEGQLPRREAVRQFLASRVPERRDVAIDAALSSEGSRRLQTERLAARLCAEGQPLGVTALLRDWVGGRVRARAPIDQIARELVAVEGIANDKREALFLLQFRAQPEDSATAIARQLLGVSLDCARCHDHPFESWKQSQFHELAAVFGRLRLRRVPGKQRRFEIFESPIGDYFRRMHGAKVGAKLVPRAIDGTSLEASPKRRQAFAKWLTAPGNPWFARAQANRIFWELFGQPAAGSLTELPALGQDGPLLPLLAKALTEANFRGDALRRLLLRTKAYQRAADVPGNKGPRLIRPLDPEQFSGALLVASGRDRPGPGELPFLYKRSLKSLRQEIRRLVPPGSMGAFGSTVPQALAQSNGAIFDGLMRARPGRPLRSLIKTHTNPRSLARELCLGILCRLPSAAEETMWTNLLSPSEDRVARTEDLAYALVSSTEFACQR